MDNLNMLLNLLYGSLKFLLFYFNLISSYPVFYGLRKNKTHKIYTNSTYIKREYKSQPKISRAVWFSSYL